MRHELYGKNWTRNLVWLALSLNLAWFFLPQIEYRWMTEDSIVLSQYSGLDAIFAFPAWLYWVILSINVLVYLLILILGRGVRFLVLAYFVIGTVFYVPVAGMNIETGLSMAIRDLVGICDGAILIMLFLQPASSGPSEFVNSERAENGHSCDR